MSHNKARIESYRYALKGMGLSESSIDFCISWSERYANHLMEEGKPTEAETRKVLKALCIYANDNYANFRVVAQGLDANGNGVLEFGLDCAPEDLDGSTFESLVEKLTTAKPETTG